MGKFDATARHLEGRPMPVETELMLAGLVASATVTGESVTSRTRLGWSGPS
ncbi:hypothetical protein [Modestobacter sp. URMC 112]